MKDYVVFADKNASEILPYSVDFVDRLLPGEFIGLSSVDILVFSGNDSDPNTMVSTVTPPAVSGTKITFTLQGGIPGCIYVVVVSAFIDSGNLYMKTGHLAIVASDPFAST